MKQKYALVTGTDHGVGLALAEELLARGYFVVAARLNPEEKLIDELMAKNRTKWQSCRSISETIRAWQQ